MEAKKEIKRPFIPASFLTVLFVISISLFLQATCYATTVTLQWGASDGATGYKVYYQADSSSTPFINSVDAFNQTTATISGLVQTHSYYFSVVAYNSSKVESSYSNVVAIHPLSVSFSGNGTGNVNSNPSGISCISACTSQFISGSSVTLIATPSNSSTELSNFSSWEGCPNANGNICTINLSESKSVTATFTSNLATHIATTTNYYSTLQTAYNNAGITGIIEAQEVEITGNLSASSNKALTLKGGYDAIYSERSGYTVMKGALTVGRGSLVVDNLVISD